jgi:hypothetical protein
MFDKFELFPKLPMELRLKIFKLTPEPRIVDVRFKGMVGN